MASGSALMLSVSGCRGVVGESLTPEVAARFSGAFGAVLTERAKGARVSVVLGRDGRQGGLVVQQAAIAGLTGAGCDVVDLGVAMTPTVAIMTDHVRERGQGYVAGMVITASHNPQQWNGLKCLLADERSQGEDHGSAACAPPAAIANAVIERFKAGRVGLVGWKGLGQLSRDESSSQVHVDRLLDALEQCGLTPDASTIGEGLNVVVDSVNASGVEGARVGLESLGVEEILHLGVEDTGLFPHPPEPTLENLTLPGGLSDAVRESEADVGFAQDPDADRLAIIDERGRYIGEEYTLVLSAMALLEAERLRGRTTNGLTLVTNLSTSRMLEDTAERYGASVLRTAVGEANVVEVMKREGALLGGEGNGGTIWPRMTYVRDSLSAMALTLWLISPKGAGKGKKRKLSEVIKALPAYAIEKRKVEIARREDAQPAIDKVAKAYASAKVDLQDGVRVDWLDKRAWLHVRASNTEPIMRLISEAPSKGEAEQILANAERVIAG